jgi:hypothetical protein
MMDAARVADESWLGRVLPYGPFPGQGLVDVAAGSVRELGLERGTIGVESGSSSYLPDGFVTHEEYERLVRAAATVVNAADVIDRVTLVRGRR